MNDEKQTAVEWLVRMLYSPVCRGFINGRREIPFDIITQAKQMEKEQIMDAYSEGFDAGYLLANGEDTKFDGREQYYNETYGKDNG